MLHTSHNNIVQIKRLDCDIETRAVCSGDSGIFSLALAFLALLFTMMKEIYVLDKGDDELQ
jgi:hypothetical protein